VTAGTAPAAVKGRRSPMALLWHALR